MIYPKETYEKLSDYVIGQDEAKKCVSNALFLHYMKTRRCILEDADYGPKSNMLLVGPTGCGKTHLLKSLERVHPGIPILHIDATCITKSGFDGNSLDDLILKWRNEFGIVFIDEIDKLCGELKTTKSDNWYKELQQNILKIVEGTKLHEKHGKGVDTSNILFIFGGNFKDLRENMKKEANKVSIGFKATKHEAKDFKYLHQELMNVGIIPELAGRIAQVVELEPLTKDSLREIFYSAKGPYANYIDLMNFIGYDLYLTEDEIDDIVNKAYELNTGARGLQTGLDDFLADYIFQLEEMKL